MGKKLIWLLLIVIVAACSGKTVIRSEPPTAFVTINGVAKGVTPLEVGLDCEETKEFEISVFFPGYLPQTETIRCRRIRGPNKNVFFELEPGQAPVKQMQPSLTPAKEGFGTIEIKSIPGDSEVFLNNNFIGTTPIIAQRIKSGYYIVEVRKKGFKPWRKEIRIQAKSKGKYFPILEKE
jgi:hypothetical protein